jgi:hypothetical protein
MHCAKRKITSKIFKYCPEIMYMYRNIERGDEE